MNKGLKLVLMTATPLALILGVSYGLAKMQVIPTQKMGGKNPALRSALRSLGLYKTPPAAKSLASLAAPALSPEKRVLQAQREALDKERAAWESQKQAQEKAAADKAKQEPAPVLPDPREIARLATIYEQMPADNIVKIFAKMPDPQTVALLRRMDEKKVGEVLAAIPPERAAFFTQSLSHANMQAAGSRQ